MSHKLHYLYNLCSKLALLLHQQNSSLNNVLSGMNEKQLKLLSRFFTRENYLIHQIQLLNQEGQVVFSQEFRDYGEYKATFTTLQRQISNKDNTIAKPVAAAIG